MLSWKVAESRETAGVRAGESAAGSMAAFSSFWGMTEAPNVVPVLLEDIVVVMCEAGAC